MKQKYAFLHIFAVHLSIPANSVLSIVQSFSTKEGNLPFPLILFRKLDGWKFFAEDYK